MYFFLLVALNKGCTIFLGTIIRIRNKECGKPNKLSHFIAGLWLSSYNWVWVILQELFYNRFNIHLLSVQVKLFPDNFWTAFLIITLRVECLRNWSFLWTHRCEVEAPIANFQEPTRYCCVSPWSWQGQTRYVLLVSHSSPMYTPISVVLRHSKICRKDQETKRGKEQRMQSLSIFCVFIFLEMNFYSCSPTGQLHRLQWGVHWQQC